MLVSVTPPHLPSVEAVEEAIARIEAILIVLRDEELILGKHTVGVLHTLAEEAFAFLEGRAP